MDRLQSMRVFARVIDEGSFAAAARALNLSPTVATRLVADLEDHLRVRLLNRTTRRLALTDTGEVYLERVRHILAEVDEAEALAGAATSEPRGVVRVLCPPAFAVHQLAPRLPAFNARFPKVIIDLSAPGPVATMDEDFDISILLVGGEHMLEGEFVARLLAHSAWIVCASPAYLNERGRPQRLSDFANHRVLAPLTVREVTFHADAATASSRSGAGRPTTSKTVTLESIRGPLATNHIDTLYAAARAGLGIVALPSFVVHPALQDGTLERVPLTWQMVQAHIYMAMPTRKYVPARTRALWNFLLESFGGDEKDPWSS